MGLPSELDEVKGNSGRDRNWECEPDVCSHTEKEKIAYPG